MPGRACFPIDALNGQGRAYTDIPAPQLPPDVSLAYTYGDLAHAHAVTALGGNKYKYDENGNMSVRWISGTRTMLAYDADIVPVGENRVVGVTSCPDADGNGCDATETQIAQFTGVYPEPVEGTAILLRSTGGKRVKSVEGGVTILFVGGHYEVKGSEITKYYFAGATRVAMRKYTIPQSMTVEYILGDHLASTSLTTNSTGAKTSEMRYNPWGEVRYTWTASLSTTPAYQLTRYTYTGQYSYMDDPTTAGVTEGPSTGSGHRFGLMFYQARWYDPCIMQFNQPDTLIPEPYNTLDWNRYSYTRGNPLKYTDPSGHSAALISPEDVLIIIVVAVFAIGAPLNYDNRRRANSENSGCQGTLAECFNQRQTKDFSNNQQIDQKEFNELLVAVAEDLESKYRTPLDPARAGYDTPFFTGNRMVGEKNRPDQMVCIDGQCYQQSGVNYVAQGMYSAYTGEDIEDAKKKANDWNKFWYDHEASQDELYWLEYGYNYYNDRKSKKGMQPK